MRRFAFRSRRPFFPRTFSPQCWRRAAYSLALLPLVLAGGASGGYYLRLHHVSAELSLAGLPVAPEIATSSSAGPASSRRILVFSPHCDDETLGLGGTIAEARGAGIPVTVAFLTNGDGFPLAAGRALREVHVSPNDYIGFAKARQSESLNALAVLGVPAPNVVFLSYPDRGLASLWAEHWDRTNPFTSRYTNRASSPYPRTFHPGAPYCGASLLADLARLMETVRPTDIYVTHPSDDHPDHATAAAFVQAALLAARDENRPWAMHARLRYYLVHRGDWPLPQGLHPDRPLLPPASMRALDTRWEVLPLTPRARAAKHAALERYRSQTAVAGRFLRSFVRENELQGSIPERYAVSASVSEDSAAAATVPDALRDDVVRNAGASADLSGLSVRRDGDDLWVRLSARGPISPRVRYTLRLRVQNGPDLLAAPNGAGGEAATAYETRDLPVTRAALRASAAPNVLEARISLRALGASASAAPRRVWVAAETRWAGVPVDSIGFRLYVLGPVPAPRKAGRAAVPPTTTTRKRT